MSDATSPSAWAAAVAAEAEADAAATSPSAWAAAVAAEAEADASPQLREALAAVRARLVEPLRIAVAGHVSSGKSTLVNALLGRDVAPTDAGECTQFVTEFRYAKPPSPERAQIERRNGSTRPLALHRGRLPSGTLGVAPQEVQLLRVWLTNSGLEHLTLIDTPGLNSANDDTPARTEELMRVDADSRHALGGADIVLFAVNAALNAEHVRLLREYVDGAGRSALTVLGVLGKADLVGATDDPWASAGQLAETFSRRLRREVAAVVPVLGLLAQTAETYALDEQHAADLAAMADAGIDAGHRALWSADRFEADADVPIPVERRRALVNILDMYGIKLGVTLAADGLRGAGGLQSALAARTGLGELRRVLAETFAERAEVLKTSAALEQLKPLCWGGLREDAPAKRRLRARLSDLRDDESMHRVAEFEALRDCLTLNDAAGSPGANKHRIALTEDLYEDVARLVRSASPRQRCGLDSDASNEELMAAARAGAEKWKTFANSGVGTLENHIAQIIHQTYTMVFMQAKDAAQAGQP